MLAQQSLSIVPDPDVQFLRSGAAESGFLNVYRCTSARGDRWCAKVKTAGRLMRIGGSAAPLAHQAALHVVRWYRARYGARWREAVSRRKTRLQPYRVWHDAAAGGYRAHVWEFGEIVPVTGRRRPGRSARHDSLANCELRGPRWRDPGRPLVFASRAAAQAAVEAWAVLWWGSYPHLAMWRY